MGSFLPWKCNTFVIRLFKQNLFQSKLNSISSRATIFLFSFYPHACRLYNRKCIKDFLKIPWATFYLGSFQSLRTLQSLLLLCVTSFPLLRCHRHFSIDTFGPTNRHQTSPLLLVRLVFHFCNSKPADREDGDLSLTPWAALFGLVGGFYEVPPLVPTPMTYVPLDSTTHCVQMVATDVLSRGASRRQGPRTHRRAPGSAGSHGAIGERGKGRTGYLKEIPAKALSPSET